MGIFEDFTLRRQALEALRESEEKFRLVFEKAPLGIMHYDQTSTITNCNEKYAEIIGAPKEKFIGFNMMRQLRDDKMREAVAASLKGEEGYYEGDYLSVTAGKTTPVRAIFQPIFSTDGALSGGVAIFEDISQRKRAEELLAKNHNELQDFAHRLEQSRDMLQLIIESIPVRVFWKDNDLRYMGCNTLFAHDAGFSNPQQLLGKDDFAMGWKEQADPYRRDDRQVMESRRSKINIVEPQTTPAGDKIWLKTSKVPLIQPSGEVVGVLGVYEDITEHKQAEEALLASEERYRMVADYTYDMEYWVASDGKILYMSPASERLTGYSFQAFQEDPQLLFQILHPEDQALFVNHMEEVRSLDEPRNLDFRLIHRNGQEFWVNHSCQPVFGTDGQPLGRRASNRDFTERKEAEEAFQSLVNHAPMGIYIIQHGKFAMINPGVEAITGYTAQDLLGQNCLISVSPGYRAFVREQAIQRLKGEGLSPYEYQFTNKSGEAGWVMETVTPTQYKGQRAVLGYFMDITPLKKLEAQFLQAQKMEAVGRLAGGIAHDFNNILGVIIGYTEIMLMGLKENDPLCGYLGEIKRAAVRAASLTRQLLAFSRRQIQQLEIINLNEVVTDLEKMLERVIGEDLELVLKLDSALPSMKADKGQIEQIILNLAVNAKDAMPQGGKLTIETCDVYLDETYCRDHPYVSPGHFVMMTVSDNGTGMDEETRAHIFEPFYTTKEIGKGTGLGLSTVFGIVKQSGGSIEVYSEAGVGTTLKVYLPSVEEPAEKPQAESHANPLPGHETILVVEDDDGLRPLIMDVLKMHGYEVLEARDGDEALRICKDHEGPIHLMLTDVVMPRMSGRQLADQMASLYPQMRVLFMSGYTDNAIVHHGILQEDTAFIQKPFSPDDLARKVSELLATSFPK
ncbi:MAG: PAS domain S-box protein [Desulfobaccales bacterium]